MPCFPLPPLAVLLVAFAIVAAALAETPLYCAAALGFVSLGLPVYELRAKKREGGPVLRASLLRGRGDLGVVEKDRREEFAEDRGQWHRASGKEEDDGHWLGLNLKSNPH